MLSAFSPTCRFAWPHPLRFPQYLHFLSHNLSNYFKKDAKWTKSVHDFSEMDKKCPSRFHRKLKIRKFENLEITHFPTQENTPKQEKK